MVGADSIKISRWAATALKSGQRQRVPTEEDHGASAGDDAKLNQGVSLVETGNDLSLRDTVFKGLGASKCFGAKDGNLELCLHHLSA